MKYLVNYAITYVVDAETQEDAEEKASEMFANEMRSTLSVKDFGFDTSEL